MHAENGGDGLLTHEQKEKLIDRLKERGVPQNCPMCQNASGWTIGQGYIAQRIAADLKNRDLNGPAILSIPIICSNCGFTSHHNLGALGLFNNEDQK